MTTFDSQGNPVPAQQAPPEVDQYRQDANSAGANFAPAPTDAERNGQPDQAQAQHRAPEAQPENQPEPETAKDERPALASAGPEFDTNAAEGVDMTTLPAFKSVQRMLPAQRMRSELSAAKMVTGLPDSLTALVSGDGEIDMTALQDQDLDALMDLFDNVQEAVLEAAQDRTAMEDWLMAQEDPTQAIMSAFTQYRSDLGN